MKVFLCALLLIGVYSTALPAQSGGGKVYTIDGAHSLLDFTTRLVGFNRVRGAVNSWSGDFYFDPARPLAGIVSFSAQVASIKTGIGQRDRHLQSIEFFDATRFPRISFFGRVVSASVAQLEVEGRLTIRDSTRTLRFPVHFATPEGNDAWGNRRLVFAGSIQLNRHDFGVVGPAFWNNAISDSVTIEFEMAGRIWDYRTLNFGRPEAYYGPAFIAASDSGQLPQAFRRLTAELAAETDSTRGPTPFEVEVTIGRLAQGGKAVEALQVLEMVAGWVGKHWRSIDQGSFEARKGEMFARLGQFEEARRHLDAALRLNPDDTNALVWRTSLVQQRN